MKKNFWIFFSGIVIDIADDREGKRLQAPVYRSGSEEWDRACTLAGHYAESVKRVIDLAKEEFEIRDELHDDIHTEMEFEDGFKVLCEWLPCIGLNTEQTLRRMHLMKRFNIPRRVSVIADGRVNGLTEYLREGIRAFLLGADFATVFLLRAIIKKNAKRALSR